MNHNPLPTMLVIDFETNGAKTPEGKLDLQAQVPVEVCAARVVAGEITSVFNTLIYYNADDHATGWSEALENGHHSRNDLLKGMNERAAASILWDMVLGDDKVSEDVVLCAFNASFDFTVLKNMFLRAFDHCGMLDHTEILCPLTIARDRFSGSHKLTAVAAKYNVLLEDAHTAHDDTLALVDIVNAMHQEGKGDILPYINVLGYKRQYGEPAPGTYPEGVTLKPQGHETFYHSADGNVTKQTNVGKPFQRVVMGKPVRPAPPVPGK